MDKRPVRYIVSMEQIRKYMSDGRKKFFRKPDFQRLRDADYRAYVIRRAVIYIGLSVFCVAFLLLLSASTSPLYNGYCDGDSSIFMLIGKAITKGKNVYTDYFDHKGPLLFYINALGFMMTGTKTGVFIIQCAVLSLTAIFMYKTARIFTKTFRALICVLISLLAFAATVSDGNLSEEYCMLLCLIPIYRAVRFYTKTPDAPHPYRCMTLYGICFALCAFIRINNGVMIGGIVLTALLADFVNERPMRALFGILYFLLGAVCVSVPICVFFIIKETFHEMIFSTFTFNFLYAAEGSSLKSLSAVTELIKWTLPVISLAVLSLIFANRLGTRIASLMTALSVFALIPILMGFGYTHYYTTLIPLITLYTAVVFRIAANRINVLSVLICAVAALTLGGYFETLPYNLSHYAQLASGQSGPAGETGINPNVEQSVEKLSAFIPKDERGDVFGYNVSAAWFLQADIMPCFRVFTLQEEWAEHYPQFGRDINEMMIEDPPKWVIIHNIKIIESKQFLMLLDDNYELVSEFGYDMLYRRTI